MPEQQPNPKEFPILARLIEEARVTREQARAVIQRMQELEAQIEEVARQQRERDRRSNK